MSKTQLLLVTVPALLMLGFVGRDGVITRQWCCSLVLTYGWSIWSHQNKMTVAFPVHTWKALGHTQRQHAHTCRNVHVEQREKGKRSFQMTIHLGLSGYSAGTNFPKQYFHLSFSSLLFGEISRVSIRLQSHYRSVFFSKKRGFQTLSGAFAPQILLRPWKGLLYQTPLDSRFTIVYNTCFFYKHASQFIYGN